MIFVLLQSALAGGFWVAPELGVGITTSAMHGANMPDQSECILIECNTKTVTPVTYGVTLVSEKFQLRVRRTTLLRTLPGTRPYVLSVRAGPWFELQSDSGHDPYWFPIGQLHPIVGLRYVHHTKGPNDVMQDGLALELGFEVLYTADQLPDGAATYVEITVLRYLDAAWRRRSTGRGGGYGGWIFRTGLQMGPVYTGVNLTGDPGFGFSGSWEVGFRGGLKVLD